MSQSIKNMVTESINRMKLIEQDCTEWLVQNTDLWNSQEPDQSGFVIQWGTSFLPKDFKGGNVMDACTNNPTQLDPMMSGVECHKLVTDLNNYSEDGINKFYSVPKSQAVKNARNISQKFIKEMTKALKETA